MAAPITNNPQVPAARQTRTEEGRNTSQVAPQTQVVRDEPERVSDADDSVTLSAAARRLGESGAGSALDAGQAADLAARLSAQLRSDGGTAMAVQAGRFPENIGALLQG